jgi:hypothetical protein
VNVEIFVEPGTRWNGNFTSSYSTHLSSKTLGTMQPVSRYGLDQSLWQVRKGEVSTVKNYVLFVQNYSQHKCSLR